MRRLFARMGVEDAQVQTQTQSSQVQAQVGQVQTPLQAQVQTQAQVQAPQVQVVQAAPQVPVQTQVQAPQVSQVQTQVQAPATVQAQVQVGDIVSGGAEELESSMVEMTENDAEFSSQQTAVDQAVQTAEALESISLALEACASMGGLSKEAAGCLGIAIASHYDTLGHEARAMPALESFGGTSSRIAQTHLACENLKENLQAIWQKIISALKNAAAWLMKQIDVLFQAGERLEKRANAMIAAAPKISGAKKENEIKNKGLVAKLAVGGKVGGNVVSTAQATADFVVPFLGFAVPESENLVTSVMGLSVDVLGSDERINSFRIKAGHPNAGDNETNSTLQNAWASTFSAAGETMPEFGIERSDEMLGGKAFFAVVAKSDVSGVAAVLAASVIRGYVDDFDSKVTASGETLPVLTTSDIANVAKVAARLGRASSDFRKHKKNLLDSLKAVEAAASKLMSQDSGDISGLKKAAGDVSDKADRAEFEGEMKTKGRANIGIRVYRKLATSYPSRVIAGFTQMNKYALTTGKALLDYAELSAKCYEGGMVSHGDAKAIESK